MAILDFFGISKSLKDFAAQVSDLRFQIETLQRQIEDVEFAPASTVDVLAALKTWAQNNEVRYQTHLKAQLNRLTTKAAALSEPSAVHSELAYGVFLQEPQAARMSLDVQLCGLLGPDRFVDLIGEKLAALNMPEPGLPLAERANVIKGLKAKQAILRNKERDLLDAAEKAGLTVS